MDCRETMCWEREHDRVEGRQFHVAAPRRLLGLQPGDFAMEFKWIDNAQTPGDILNAYIDGAAAPDGRFRYRYDTRSSNKDKP